MASDRLARISTASDGLRVLIYDGKVSAFAGKDADGKPEGGQLWGSATYNSAPGSLESTLTMTLQ